MLINITEAFHAIEVPCLLRLLPLRFSKSILQMLFVTCVSIVFFGGTHSKKLGSRLVILAFGAAIQRNRRLNYRPNTHSIRCGLEQ